MGDSSISLGLDAIFKNVDEKDIDEKTAELDLISIQKSPYQARKSFSPKELAELTSSIKEHGILQPLLVRRNKKVIELIAGERRLRAAKLLNLKTVPVVWCDVSDETASAYGLIENIQRQNLNSLEEAEAYERLIDEFKLSHEELSSRVGKSRSHITNILRLTRLHPAVKSYLIADEISMGHARALLSIQIDEQQAACEHIIEKSLSVRETETYLKRLYDINSRKDANNEFKADDLLNYKVKSWMSSMNTFTNTKSKIIFDKKGRAKLILLTQSPEEMELLVKKIIEKN